MKRLAGIVCVFAAGLSVLGFRYSETAQSASLLINKLAAVVQGSPVKEQKIELTPEGFFRLRKKYPGGKEEYFSFHFSRYKNLEYYGTDTSGYADLTVNDSNIIVQTFRDPKGNIDSMAMTLRIGLNRPTAEDMARLHQYFSQLKNENLPIK